MPREHKYLDVLPTLCALDLTMFTVLSVILEWNEVIKIWDLAPVMQPNRKSALSQTYSATKQKTNNPRQSRRLASGDVGSFITFSSLCTPSISQLGFHRRLFIWGGKMESHSLQGLGYAPPRNLDLI